MSDLMVSLHTESLEHPHPYTTPVPSRTDYTNIIYIARTGYESYPCLTHHTPLQLNAGGALRLITEAY